MLLIAGALQCTYEECTTMEGNFQFKTSKLATADGETAAGCKQVVPQT